MSQSINRRRFLRGAAALTTLAAPSVKSIRSAQASSRSLNTKGDLFVGPAGDDAHPGTEAQPLRTLAAAKAAVRLLKASTAGPITVYLRSGTYYMEETLVFSPEDSGTPEAPVRYRPYPGDTVAVSGGTLLSVRWKPYQGGIMMASVPHGTRTEQIFVNGVRQILARYPNYDPAAGPLSGTSPDAFSRTRARRWSHPEGGYIHALHEAMWGDMHYRITGKTVAGDITYEGGWQNNRPAPMHQRYRFVENIFEELDAPGEWFLDEAAAVLYFYPPVGLDLSSAKIETARLKHLIEFRGSEERPVRGIELCGLTFRHAARTFMQTREPLLRSDWRIYRGGAVLFDGAEDCRVEQCFLDQLGGNAIFISNYNRRIRVARCHIAEAGASGVCFVGNPAAVRNPLFAYNERLTVDKLDRTPGPRTNQYPKDCVLEDSLITRTGVIEKQTSPVEISMSANITVRHCSLYDVPRAGINIGDGTWGGHRIEHCDVFDTVKETGDHGAFNSWGRDRWWNLDGVDLDTVLNGDLRALPVLDTVAPIVLTNSRWSCEHGWDIDLDDGSTNYRIVNNLCLNGGLKLREGFLRECQNNVMVNNTLHPHVWFNDSDDLFERNIVFTPYRPIQMRAWTSEIDFNLLHAEGVRVPGAAIELQALSGQDSHSLKADAHFVDASVGDYRLSSNSPGLAIGFVNFAMDDFGVRDPALRALARTPKLHYEQIPSTLGGSRAHVLDQWMGVTVRNISGPGEVSALGAPGETGALVTEVRPGSVTGLQPNDLILEVDFVAESVPIGSVDDLLKSTQNLAAGVPTTVEVLRQQQRVHLKMRVPE